MGVRRAKGKRRGIQWGVQKHKIGHKLGLSECESTDDRRILGIHASHVSRLAEYCYSNVCHWSCILYVLPAEYICGELVLRKNWKRWAVYYTLVAAQATNAVHKVLTLVPLLLESNNWANN